MRVVRLLLFGAVVICLVALFWRAPSVKHNDNPRVIATVAPLFVLTSFIAGDVVDVGCLIGFNSDPHAYQLVKGDGDKVSSASMLVVNGLGLEHGPLLLSSINNHANVVVIGDYLIQKHSHKLIVESNVYDPHIWMDPNIMILAVDPIRDGLCRVFPDNRSIFESNSYIVKERLRRLSDSVKEAVNRIPDDAKYIVSAHDAFKYFIKAYFNVDNDWQDRFIAPEGLAPEGQISFAQLDRVIEFILFHKVKTVFPEVNVGRLAIDKIVNLVSKAGREIAVCDSELYSDSFPSNIVVKDILEMYEYMILFNAYTISKSLINDV